MKGLLYGKRSWWIAAAMTLFLLVAVSAVSPAHAVTMEKSSVTIASSQEKVKCDKGKIEKVDVGTKKLVSYEINGKNLTLYPLKAGTDVVTITGTDGTTATITVTVDAAYMRGILAGEVGIGNAWYGTKKLVITGEPVTTGKVVIGGKTYKFTIKAGTTKAVVKLAKVYPLNKAYKVTFNKYNVAYVKSGKLKSNTRMESTWVTGKKVYVKCFNLHKGDKVKVTFKKKTYTKKIKKNYDGKDKTVVIKLKKAPKFDSKLKVKIVNKSKKKLYLKKFQLSNFAYQ